MATAEQALGRIGEIGTDRQETFDWSVPPGMERASIVARIVGLRRRSRDSRCLEGTGEAIAIGRETGVRV